MRVALTQKTDVGIQAGIGEDVGSRLHGGLIEGPRLYILKETWVVAADRVIAAAGRYRIVWIVLHMIDLPFQRGIR